MKKYNWNRDKICDVQGLLFAANDLWDKQCFTKPTTTVTIEIIKLLSKANIELETIMDDLEEVV